MDRIFVWTMSMMVMLAMTQGCQAADPGEGGPAKARFLGRSETWDYAPAMREVAARFTGEEGVVLHLGDSITYASPYTAWARAGEGKTPEDEAVLQWSHCGEENDRDGWWLAHVDLPTDRSYTAASGVRADQYLAGGFHGMPSLDEIIRKYNPQVAILMLGTNDAWAGRPPEKYAADMETIITRLLDNGTVVILSTIPPLVDNLELQRRYNEELWRLAEKHRLPVIDFYGEILARRPGMSWNGTLMVKGDGHPSADANGVTPTSAPTPENLRESGYLLRGWLSVKKLEEVKKKVLDPVRLENLSLRTPFPRVAMFWSPVRGSDWDKPEGYAKHDLIVVSPDQIGMELEVPEGTPWGLAESYTPQSVEKGRKWIAAARRLNPNAVIFAAIDFYEYQDDALPEDHPWWLRKQGKRQQFWPGTHRMDWYNADYRAHVIRRTLAAMQAGFDGVFYDNLRDEPEPWTALLKDLREQAKEKLGRDILIIANVGYAVGEYNWAAPYLNGFQYESGWSHERTEWDDCIKAMQEAQSRFRRPKFGIIERFEEIRDYAGWPNDPHRGQKPKPDPAARHWTMCYALTIGDYYYLFSDNTSHRHDWYPEYDVKIGLPTGPGERVNSHVWRRQYQRALVVVNLPGAKSTYRVRLESPARDVFTGKTGTEFQVPPGEGVILLKEGGAEDGG